MHQGESRDSNVEQVMTIFTAEACSTQWVRGLQSDWARGKDKNAKAPTGNLIPAARPSQSPDL